jgi:hypothetical protein
MMSGQGWRKSSHSGYNGNCIEVSGGFRTSTYTSSINCVDVGYSECSEIASRTCNGTMIFVRDTKANGTGPVLAFSGNTWRRFVKEIRTEVVSAAGELGKPGQFSGKLSGFFRLFRL